VRLRQAEHRIDLSASKSGEQPQHLATGHYFDEIEGLSKDEAIMVAEQV
jgi:hypothetical protein